MAAFLVQKTDAERRITTGVLYVPSATDSQGDFVTENTLEDAVAAYMKSGDFGLRLQHDADTVVGQVIGVMAIPTEMTTDLTVPGGTTKSATLPKGTVLLSAQWSPEAWPLVKDGTLKGWSLGGRAERVHGAAPDGSLPSMGAAAVGKAKPGGLVAAAIAKSRRPRQEHPFVRSFKRTLDRAHKASLPDGATPEDPVGSLVMEAMRRFNDGNLNRRVVLTYNPDDTTPSEASSEHVSPSFDIGT